MKATHQLGELCEIVIGRTPSTKRADYYGGPHVWVNISELAQGREVVASAQRITDLAVAECRCRPIAPGTLLMSFKLSLGKVAFAGVPLFTNEAIAALPIRRPDLIDAELLYHFLASADLAQAGANRGAKGLTLNLEALARLEIPTPPLDEQRHIAATLTSLETLQARHEDAARTTAELRAAWVRRALHRGVRGQT